MALHKDWKEFIESLNSQGVEFIVVGAFSVAYHAIPRTTGDIDFWYRPTPDNAVRLENAIQQFGFGSLGLKVQDFLTPNRVVQFGRPPLRIDLINSLSGLTAEEVWASRIPGQLAGLQVHFLGREALIRNKRASGRPKDRIDLQLLGESPD
jgi:hypothetical protein